MKQNIKNTLTVVTAAAAIGGGVAAEKNGLFEDGRFKIDDSPQIERKLEATIKPKMEKLGDLALDLAERTEGTDHRDTQEYDPKTKTVTISAEGRNPIAGWHSVEAKFAAKPGTEVPNPDKVLHIETINVDNNNDEYDSTSSMELAAPGEGLYDPGEGMVKDDKYRATASGGSDYRDSSSPSGGYLHTTINNEHFVDSEWGNYKHNPVPTAKAIVRDSGMAANTIRQAFEQPPK